MKIKAYIAFGLLVFLLAGTGSGWFAQEAADPPTAEEGVAPAGDESVEAETASSGDDEPDDENFNFNVDLTPNFDGNVFLGSGFNYTYWKYLSAGFRYAKTQRGEKSHNKKTDDRTVTVIEDQTARLRVLRGVIPLVDSGSTKWVIAPSVNGQYYFQETTSNLVNRQQDSFKYENSNLESMQLNTELGMKLETGPVNWTLNSSFVPYSMQKESLQGYDSFLVSEKDEFKNIKYKGSTGDYVFNAESSLLLLDVDTRLVFNDLVGGYDLMLGYGMNMLKYDYSTKREIIDNAQVKKQTQKVEQDRLDMKFILGLELGFLNMGSSRALATFTYTRSKYQDVNGNTIQDQLYGVGVIFQK